MMNRLVVVDEDDEGILEILRSGNSLLDFYLVI